MPFQGYNYEDAIAVSARLVREDLLTTIHIDEIVMQLDPDEYLCTPEEIDVSCPDKYLFMFLLLWLFL